MFARRAGLALLAAALLAGCGGSRERVACPRVDIAEYVGDLVRFRAAPGTEPADVVFRSSLEAIAGDCEMADGAVEAALDLTFALERGPANRDGGAAFEYFVAVPQFHPRPEGKKRFPVALRFPEGRDRVLYRDRIAVRIPLPEGRSGAAFNVFIGHQLSAEEIAYNLRDIGR